MALVDVKWRPSGGRGEYEFVPDAFLNRRIVIDAISVPDAIMETDVSGRIRDGKPRLRRDDPNDHSLLNVAPLVAALAWLPAPRREDKGFVRLPLMEKEYVASAIRFDVTISGQTALARPVSMKVLHYEYEIDLAARLSRIAAILPSLAISSAAAEAIEYQAIVKAGTPSARLQELSTILREWVGLQDDPALDLENGDEDPIADEPPVADDKVEFIELSAEETTRKIRTHFKIERSLKIRKAKVEQYKNLNGVIDCENCLFDYAKRYPILGDGFIEVHHKKQLALLMPNERTYLSDLMLLCASCHRMVHRARPPHSPEFLSAHTALR